MAPSRDYDDGADSDDSSNGFWVGHRDGTREFIHDSDPRAKGLMQKMKDKQAPKKSPISPRNRDDVDDRREKPARRPRRDEGDDYESQPPPRDYGRSEKPRAHPRKYRHDEDGYGTDQPKSRRQHSPDDSDDSDHYGGRRGGRDRAQTYYEPDSKNRRRDDLRPQRSNSARTADGRDGRHSKDRRDRDRHGKDKPHGAEGEHDWKKKAGTLFMTQALPVIEREGAKFLKREMQRRLG